MLTQLVYASSAARTLCPSDLDEIARERDELRRTITELKDDHTLQLAELQTELNAAQNATEDARREAVGSARRGGELSAEAAELQSCGKYVAFFFL